MTYAEMEAELFARARHGMRLGLDRMEAALEELGRPERLAPAFHVAGTNGKGSVCAMLDAGLRAAGLKSGLYTSPHLERFAERFRVDGRPLEPDDLVSLYSELRERLPWAFQGPAALTFFEIVTLLGFLAFARARVDVMVVEVGLGGRLDATNVLVPKVACITSIGFDHREFLGDKIASIAAEKAGILKPGCPAVIARQPPDALAPILDRAQSIGAPVSVEGRDFELLESDGGRLFRSDQGTMAGIELGLRGAHQRSNAAVALRALEIARLGGLPVEAPAARWGLANVQWPGRLETVSRRPEIVLDGAHNPPAAVALAAACREIFAGRRIHLVLGVLADKEVQPMVDALAPVASRIIVTAPSSPRALSAHGLAAHVSGVPLQVIDVAADALAHVVRTSRPEDVVLVCGSLYLVGELRAVLHGARSEGPAEILR